MNGLDLYPHQKAGVAWMLQRESCVKCPGGLLLDDCGVGKTPQVVATLKQNPKATTLIVAPVGILKQWQQQLSRWAPEFDTVIYETPLQSAKHGGSAANVKLLRNKKKRALPVVGKEVQLLVNSNTRTLSSPVEGAAERPRKRIKLPPAARRPTNDERPLICLGKKRIQNRMS